MRIEPTLQVEAPDRGTDTTLADAPAAARVDDRMRDHDIYSQSSAMVLLYFTTYLLSVLTTATALRSIGHLTMNSMLYFSGGFVVVVAVSVWIRPLLRDLYTDFSLRERAAILLLQGMAFFAPMLIFKPWYLAQCLLSLLVTMHLIITERQHFTRLISLQLLTLFVAQLTEIEDDLFGFAASLAGVALTAVAAFAMRMAFVMEKFEVVFPVSIGRIVRSLAGTLMLLLAIGGGVYFWMEPTTYRNRPTINIEGDGRHSLKITTVEAHDAGRFARYVVDGVLLAATVLAMIWLAAQIRDRLAKRSAKELALDLSVHVEEAIELPRGVQRRRPRTRDARQMIINAYVDFCRRAGGAVRERAPGETPHEYADSLLEDADSLAQDESLDELTTDFERARYSSDEFAAEDAKAYVKLTRALTKRLAEQTDNGPQNT